MPRLIWQLEKSHASNTGRMQAEMRSLWREFSTLRDGLQLSATLKPALPATEAVAGASGLAPALAREVKQMRSEVHVFCEQSATAERTARAAAEAVESLREEVRKCAEDATASASAAKLAARASARSQQIFSETKSTVARDDAKAARNDATASMEQRLHAIEEMQMTCTGALLAPVAATDDGYAVEVRAQVAALERQVGHLRELSVEASRNVEQDQVALRAILRTSRQLAERLGVGPVLLGRETASSIAAEAEGLADGVAAAWRRQKASGAIPAGAANVLDALRLQRAEIGSPRKALNIDEAPAPKPLAGVVSRLASLRQPDPLLIPSSLDCRGDIMFEAAGMEDCWYAETTGNHRT